MTAKRDSIRCVFNAIIAGTADRLPDAPKNRIASTLRDWATVAIGWAGFGALLSYPSMQLAGLAAFAIAFMATSGQ